MIDSLFAMGSRFLIGATVRDNFGEHNQDVPRVYYSNHTSHLDFLVIWSSFPKHLRKRVRPVAAKEYWERGALRRYLVNSVFSAVLVDRTKVTVEHNPMDQLVQVVKDENKSLIIFPEGTRHSDGELGKFKGGIYHLATKVNGLEFVPVYVQNLNRILPKGEVLPVPMLCSIAFGPAIRLGEEENKADFLARARRAMEELSRNEI